MLVFVKHDFEEEPIPCPVCGEMNVVPRGYSGIGVKKWECRNPECAARSAKGNCKVYSSDRIVYDAYKTEDNIIPDDVENGLRNNIIYAEPIINDDEKTTSIHTHLLPKEIADVAIRFYSGVGDKVLDPYMGSGMTAVSADEYGREFLGFEYDSVCFKEVSRLVDKIARKRSANNSSDKAAKKTAGSSV